MVVSHNTQETNLQIYLKVAFHAVGSVEQAIAPDVPSATHPSLQVKSQSDS